MRKHRQDIIRIALLLGLCGLSIINCSQILLSNEDGQAVQVEFINQLDNSVIIESSGDNTFLIEKDGKTVLKYTQIENINEIDSSKVDVHGTFNSNLDLKVQGDLRLESMSDSIYYRAQKQWKLFEFDDFQSEKKGWSQQTISSCGTSENIFLGGHCNFGGLIVTKEYTNIPPRSYVNVKFNYHFFDDWNGDVAFAQINGSTMWQESYTWCTKLMVQQCKNQGINICGKDTPDRYSYPVSFSFFNEGNSFTLGIGSNLTKSPCDASWGIDDVQIFIH